MHRPERFMPGGEYDQFDEAIRPYMFLPFIQVRGWMWVRQVPSLLLPAGCVEFCGWCRKRWGQ